MASSWGIVLLLKKRKIPQTLTRLNLTAAFIGILTATAIMLDACYRISLMAKGQLYTLLFFVINIRNQGYKIQLQKRHGYAMLILAVIVYTTSIDAPLLFILVHLGILLIISFILFGIGLKKTQEDITFMGVFIGLFIGFLLFESGSKDILDDLEFNEIAINSLLVFFLQYLWSRMVGHKTASEASCRSGRRRVFFLFFLFLFFSFFLFLKSIITLLELLCF